MTSPLSRRRLCAAAIVLGAVALPATASAADNPRVMRIDPTTGTATKVAAGAPWTTLGGMAVGPTGTIYVANQGPVGPNPKGAGVYSLTAPRFAKTQLATGAPAVAPADVIAAGSTVYALDGDRVETAGPGVPSVVSSGGLYDQYGVQPQFGAISGATLYTTASTSCGSAEGGGSYVIAVNTLNGSQSLVKSLGCRPVGGIAVTGAGQLLVAQGGRPARILQIDPASGATSTMSSGGSLRSPQEIALDAAGDLLVADATSGVVAVSGQGGGQSPITARGVLNHATGIAVGSDASIYVSDAGPAPRLRATAAGRQRFSPKGVALKVACSRRCTVAYDASVRIAGATGFAKDGAVRSVRARRSARITFPRQVNRRIAAALRRGRTVRVAITATPQDPRTGAAGAARKLRVRLG